MHDEQPAASDKHILELLWLRMSAAAMAGEGHFVLLDNVSAGTYARALDRVISTCFSTPKEKTCPPDPAVDPSP